MGLDAMNAKRNAKQLWQSVNRHVRNLTAPTIKETTKHALNKYATAQSIAGFAVAVREAMTRGLQTMLFQPTPKVCYLRLTEVATLGVATESTKQADYGN